MLFDELAIIDHNEIGSKYCFSDSGDSGLLVWDSNRFVSGPLWGVSSNEFVT